MLTEDEGRALSPAESPSGRLRICRVTCMSVRGKLRTSMTWRRVEWMSDSKWRSFGAELVIRPQPSQRLGV